MLSCETCVSAVGCACVVMMYCSHVTACVYIRRWTGGEVSDDAGAAVQKQLAAIILSKKKRGQNEWRTGD